MVKPKNQLHRLFPFVSWFWVGGAGAVAVVGKAGLYQDSGAEQKALDCNVFEL